MSWSTTRQLLIALGIGVCTLALTFFVYISFFYNAPSCADGIQNQSEEGIDCGGSCARLCTAPNVSVLWARAVKVAPGVYHAVAQIKNPDTTAVGTFPYTVSLFDAENILVAVREGTFTIEPGEIAPLFEANIVTGERVPVRTFVDIAPGVFEHKERATPPVHVISFEADEAAGKVYATIENRTLFPVQHVVISALLYNNSDILTNASQTVLERLGARAREDIVFTWQEPFSEKPAAIEIIPRVVK